MPKNTSEKKIHDEYVRAAADELKKQNWDVKSNIEVGDKSSETGTFAADIVASKATKGELRRICQILTEKDFKGDKQAYIEFRNYCDEYDLHFYVVDKDGKRREVDPKDLSKK